MKSDRVEKWLFHQGDDIAIPEHLTHNIGVRTRLNIWVCEKYPAMSSDQCQSRQKDCWNMFAVCGCKGCFLLPLRGAIVLSIQNKINIVLSIITTPSSFPMISISQIWRVWLLNWYMREWLFTSPHFIVYLLFCTYAWYYSHLFYVRMSCSHRPLYSLSLLSWMM